MPEREVWHFGGPARAVWRNFRRARDVRRGLRDDRYRKKKRRSPTMMVP